MENSAVTPADTSASIRFRAGEVTDIDALVMLIESAYRGDASRAGWTTEADLLKGHRTDAARVGEVIAGSNSRMLLAFDGEQLVGCCHLERRSGGVAYFGMFAVSPLRQGMGAGTAVLAEAERLAGDEWGAEVMEMSVIRQREDLIDWYRRRGYEPTGRTLPFPYGDQRYGIPQRGDLEFVVLARPLGSRPTDCEG